MALKLAKTLGGTNGAPEACGKCGEKHFAKSGIAWHCLTCGNYHPTELGFNMIREYMDAAKNGNVKEFKKGQT